MARRKTQSEYEMELSKVNPNVKIIGDYMGASLPIKCICKICGNIWSPVASSLLSGHGCAKCYHKKRADMDRKPYSQFLSELKDVQPDIRVSGDYNNTDSKMNCVCKICGHKWVSSPHRLLRGDGCANCKGLVRKTTAQFIEELKEINPDIEVIGEYKNNKTNIECLCKKCNNTWSPTPHSLLGKKSGCPVCAESKGEKRVEKFLLSHNLEFQRQVKFDDLLGINNGLLSYDFYLPKYNLLIEYQGEFHDGKIKSGYNKNYDFSIRQEHDERKYQYAKYKKINLLEIWYYDFDNIESILERNLFGGEINGVNGL